MLTEECSPVVGEGGGEQPLAEYAMGACLEKLGFEVFLPSVQTPHPRRGHGDVPLFPGYLFVRCDPQAGGLYAWHPMTHLINLVTFEGNSPPVRDEVVENLQRRVEAMNKSGGLGACFRPGDWVQVRLGPEERLGRVVTEPKPPRERVRVLVEFLGRLVRAEVRLRDVWAAKNREPAGNWPSGRPPRRTRGRGRWIKGLGPRADSILHLRNNRHSSL